eukprot:6177784-Pleurochrysis_carterae.AAC.1
MRACMSFHLSLPSATARSHLTYGDADDAPASSNGSASADSGVSFGTSAEGPASSSHVESLLLTVKVSHKTLRLEVALYVDDELDENLCDLVRLRKARERIAGVAPGRRNILGHVPARTHRALAYAALRTCRLQLAWQSNRLLTWNACTSSECDVYRMLRAAAQRHNKVAALRTNLRTCQLRFCA